MDVAAPTLDPGPPREAVAGGPLEARWLGRIGYRDAWALQHELVERRVAGEIPDQLLLLEHPAVLTLGRQAEESHVLAPPAELAVRGIEVIRVERGGEVTYHGPGQLVAYPIVALSRRGLLVRPLVRALEGAMTDTCAALGVVAGRREGHPGCWCDVDGALPRKIGALGLRVERGVSYHGIALNVDPDLADFDLIDACGMPGVVSTSIARELAFVAGGAGAAAPGWGTGAHAPGYIPLVDRESAHRSPSDPSRSDAPAGITGNRGLGPIFDAPAGIGITLAAGNRVGTTVDAPRGITAGLPGERSEHDDSSPSAYAPRAIDPDVTTPELSVERAARIFARALAGHLGAGLEGFAATDRASMA